MKLLLFGATGSAGAAVLDACLGASVVEEVRAVTRRPLMHTSSKLRTFLHKDFVNYATVEEAFRGVDACLFCLGVSATQVSREEYRKITYSYTLAAAQMFKSKSPGAAFHYISGQGTRPDSRMFWSRVKAQTEHDLIELVDAVCWRPAFIDAPPSRSCASSSRFRASTFLAQTWAAPCSRPPGKICASASSKTAKSAKSRPAPISKSLRRSLSHKYFERPT